ncbi:hypothetical protein N657DRAFT_647458 [Parathielavia appendiculata]|uniref:Uncharacterized protein n=1 Tax=Parathielavia appendiculata TaxID=2587402 RepID=A0AAN6TWR8_9PEZI|nr:hypothetical protein N657DRAFT_647458 [Parathielavia appendiculata]
MAAPETPSPSIPKASHQSHGAQTPPNGLGCTDVFPRPGEKAWPQLPSLHQPLAHDEP